MEKTLNFRVREDVSIYDDILPNTKYIGEGCSKTTYAKDDLIYKLPIGYGVLDATSFTTTCEYPYEYEDFASFIENTVAYDHPELVWSIGQIVFEVMVWEHLKQLEAEGFDISGFAEIKDYFVDKNGVPVIVQEYCHCDDELRSTLPDYNGDIFEQKNCKTLEALREMGFYLRDIRYGNIGYNKDGILKCFDFGISDDNPIENYDPYSDYEEGSDTYSYEY